MMWAMMTLGDARDLGVLVGLGGESRVSLVLGLFCLLLRCCRGS